jgi:hypothetical protein
LFSEGAFKHGSDEIGITKLKHRVKKIATADDYVADSANHGEISPNSLWRMSVAY